jgi:hypothetical protein
LNANTQTAASFSQATPPGLGLKTGWDDDPYYTGERLSRPVNLTKHIGRLPSRCRGDIDVNRHLAPCLFCNEFLIAWEMAFRLKLGELPVNLALNLS